MRPTWTDRNGPFPGGTGQSHDRELALVASAAANEAADVNRNYEQMVNCHAFDERTLSLVQARFLTLTLPGLRLRLHVVCRR